MVIRKVVFFSQTNKKFPIKKMELWLLLPLMVVVSGASTKTWTKSVNLDNPAMWMNGRLPCKGQTVVLPENQVAYMSHNFKFGSQVILPSNGMILMPKSGIHLLVVVGIRNSFNCSALIMPSFRRIVF